MAQYRVLSLDGGGSWALIQVKALINLYGPDASGHDVLRTFDLAAANSGGSIVLGCLIENLKLSETLAFFNDESKRKAVFSKTDSIGDDIVHAVLGFGPKYSAQKKLPALQSVLPTRGNLLLGNAVNGIRREGSDQDLHVLITSFDYDSNRATFFRSESVQGASWGRGDKADVTLAEAIHASTNAPVNYFDGPASFPNRTDRYWDGAITGSNNPVLAAVTEAIGIGESPETIVALSIGTATVALPAQDPGQPVSVYCRQPSKTGLVNDLKKLAGSILDDPPDIASFLAHVMTGAGNGLAPGPIQSRIVRMNPLISPEEVKGPQGSTWTPPGSMTEAQFEFLMNLEMDAVEQDQVDAINKYADFWLADSARNQPIRMDGDTLQLELGQERFSAAKSAWLAIR